MKIITPDKIKTKGFLKLHREHNHLLFTGVLSIDEFGLLMVLVMNADWDIKHKNFGRVCIPNKLLGEIKGFNRNKVAILKESLNKKGLVKKVDEENSVDVIEIIDFNKYQPNPNFGYAGIIKSLDKEVL